MYIPYTVSKDKSLHTVWGYIAHTSTLLYVFVLDSLTS